MTNKQFFIAGLLSIGALVFFGVVSLEILDYLKETQRIDLSPSARIVVVLISALVPYSFLSKAFRSEVKRRGVEWREKKGGAPEK